MSRWFAVLASAVAVAMLTVLLGSACYDPVAIHDEKGDWVLLVVWVLGLFCGLATVALAAQQGGEAPEDSWVVLARQNHEAYVTDKLIDAAAVRASWGGASIPEVDNHCRHSRSGIPDAGAANQNERLPRFFRDDNLSQQ